MQTDNSLLSIGMDLCFCAKIFVMIVRIRQAHLATGNRRRLRSARLAAVRFMPVSARRFRKLSSGRPPNVWFNLTRKARRTP